MLLAGCGTGTAGPGGDGGSPAAGYPVTVISCGQKVTLDRPPERVVSLYPGMTEQLIALGQDDRVVAQSGTGQGEPLEQYRAEFSKIKSLGADAPSTEALLSERPELLLAEGTYHFGGKTLPSLDKLAEKGVQTYISHPLCPEHKVRSTVEDVFTDFENLGTLFGATAAADKLVAQYQGRLAAVQEKLAGTSPVKSVVVTVFDKQLYVDAGGLYTDVLTKAGGKNLTARSELPAGEYYAPMSPEAVLKKDPEAILFTYLDEEGKQTSETFLRKTFAGTRAVRQDRLIAVPEMIFAGGVHAVPGVEELAARLHPDEF